MSHHTLRKVTIAAASGTIIEWLDFSLYAFMAPMIAMAFFPADDAVAGILKTFAIFAVAFLLRPVGAAFFGTLGDRVGRKKVLALTVFLMALSTTLIGVLPGYATWGIWAPLLLALVRCVQGFSAGGEYAGAAVYVIEHAPPGKRSQYTSWMPFSSTIAFVLAAFLSYLATLFFSATTMQAWGWRVPFLVAAPLGIVAFYIRNRLHESPLFQGVLDNREKLPPVPLPSIIRRQWRNMLLLGGFVSLNGLSYYMFAAHMTTFLRSTVGLPANLTLLSNVIALSFAALVIPPMGWLCDRIGRRPFMTLSIVLLIAFSLPAYALANSGTFGNALLAQCLLALGASVANVASVVVLGELFPIRMRYAAAAMTQNVSFALFGGTAPMVATFLIAATGTHLAPAWYIIAVAVGAFICTRFLPETSEQSIGREEIRQALRAGTG